MFDLEQLLRPHLRTLVPYSSARDDYQGTQGVFLDANENPFGSITDQDWNRYPDPYQRKLKEKLAGIRGISAQNIYLGNGSDEPIDLLLRAFCEPGLDNVIINPPTYGMYKVSADINNVEVREVLLTEHFELDVNQIFSSIGDKTKLIFICSPNNPTGNDLSLDAIREVIGGFRGIVIVDEAYIDFCSRASFVEMLEEFPNLVVLQTFSKAWGLAGLRLGVAYCSEEIMVILKKIKAPYNLSGLTQEVAMEALDKWKQKDEMVKRILENREKLREDLSKIDSVMKIYPSDANFLLVEMEDAHSRYQNLVEQGVIVRDRSGVILCNDALRITVGTKQENARLVEELKKTEK